MKQDAFLSNPLWEFACQKWEVEELQEMLLVLQAKHDCDINFVLFLGWASQWPVDLRENIAAFVEQTDDWHKNLVTQIRSLRQAIPSLTSDNVPEHTIQAIKSPLLEAELHAENVTLHQLYLLFSAHYPTNSEERKLNDPVSRIETLVNNLNALTQYWNIEIKQDRLRKLCLLLLDAGYNGEIERVLERTLTQ